jgi:predicted outer membrane repeat protein
VWCYRSDPLIADSRFEYNQARDFSAIDGFGGAIYCDYDSNPIIQNCDFYANQAPCGGAIFGASDCYLTIIGCTFDHNGWHAWPL